MTLDTRKFKTIPEKLRKYTEEISISDTVYILLIYSIYRYKRLISVLTEGLFSFLKVATLLDLKSILESTFSKKKSYSSN